MSIYDRLLIEIFQRHKGATKDEFGFEREEMESILRSWGERVKNLGDVIYSYRSGRRSLPEEISSTGDWYIGGRGRGRYAFQKLSRSACITLPVDLQVIPILDATPDIILKYGGTDEQGILTQVRYNRLIDTFLGVTAYHLQGHIRAYVEGQGQVEVDDLYFGVDKDGGQYVIPVEAKTMGESLGVIQIVNQNCFARERFPDLTLRSVAVKVWDDDTLFFLEFTPAFDPNEVKVVEYRRYTLVREQ